MSKMSLATYHNQPVNLEIRDGYIHVMCRDGRILAAPLDWFPWLRDATLEQQSNYKIYPFSIDWDELDEGIDMAMLAGNYWKRDELLTPEAVAEMHGLTPNTIYRILRKELEEDLEDNEYRLSGAFYDGEGTHRTWYIPRESAEAFQPDKRGRKPVNEG